MADWIETVLGTAAGQEPGSKFTFPVNLPETLKTSLFSAFSSQITPKNKEMYNKFREVWIRDFRDEGTYIRTE